MHSINVAIHFIFTAYTVMLFVRIMSSWLPHFQQFSIMRFVHYFTEPYLKFFRRVVPNFGMMDLSPLLAFFALRLVEKILLRVIH